MTRNISEWNDRGPNEQSFSLVKNGKAYAGKLDQFADDVAVYECLDCSAPSNPTLGFIADTTVVGTEYRIPLSESVRVY